jgi:aryl-alcohol dehydrogenase-like predicted oxidoreductase
MAQRKIPTRQLGTNGPTVGAIGFGAMGAFYRPLHCNFLLTIYGSRYWSVRDNRYPEDRFDNSVRRYYGKTDEAEAIKTLTYALDRGITYWDTAGMCNKCHTASYAYAYIF